MTVPTFTASSINITPRFVEFETTLFDVPSADLSGHDATYVIPAHLVSYASFYGPKRIDPEPKPVTMIYLITGDRYYVFGTMSEVTKKLNGGA